MALLESNAERRADGRAQTVKADMERDGSFEQICSTSGVGRQDAKHGARIGSNRRAKWERHLELVLVVMIACGLGAEIGVIVAWATFR
jgi:hypothetical protein